MTDPTWHKQTKTWVDGNIFPETRRGPTLMRLNKLIAGIVAAEVKKAKRPARVRTVADVAAPSERSRGSRRRAP